MCPVDRELVPNNYRQDDEEIVIKCHISRKAHVFIIGKDGVLRKKTKEN